MDKLKQFLSGRSKWTRIPSDTDEEDFKLISSLETENIQPTQLVQSATPPMKAKENVLNFSSLKPSKKAPPKATKPEAQKLIDDEVPLINL